MTGSTGERILVELPAAAFARKDTAGWLDDGHRRSALRLPLLVQLPHCRDYS